MSNLFKNMSTEGLEAESDRIGGFEVYPTDAYLVTIKEFYAGQADSGSRCITLAATMPNGKEYRQTMYFTNAQGEHWFLNKADPTKKVAMPTFTLINDICLMATGVGLAEQDAQDKIVMVRNKTTKQDEPTSVPMLINVLGKKVLLGIQEVLEYKQVQVNNVWTDTADERKSNEIVKVFHGDLGLTSVEAINGATTAEQALFLPKWIEANKGKPRDKRKAPAPGTGRPGVTAGGPPKAAAPGAAAAPARKGLFG